MALYGKSIGTDFPVEAVESSANAAKALSELENGLKNHRGIFQVFNGDSDLGSFAVGIVPFGRAMALYGKSIGTDFPSEAVESSANAAKALSELENGLKNHMSIFTIFTGDSDLSTFAAGIVPFGEAMKAYGNAIGDSFPEEAVISSANAGKALGELESGLKNHDGIFQIFFGDNDLEKFSKGIEPFGRAMSSYGKAIGKDFPAEAVESSANAALALGQLEAGLKNHNGILQIFTGDNDIQSFTEGIVPFGEAMKKYAEVIGDKFPDKAVESSVNAGKTLASITEILPSVGGIGSWFSGNKQSLDDFGKNISKLGDGIHGFYCSIFEDDAGQISSVVASVVDIAEMGKILSDMDVSVFSKFGSSLKEMAQNGVHGFTAGFVEAEPRMLDTAQFFIEEFEDKIRGSKDEIYVVFNGVVIAVLDAIEKLEGSFEDEGVDIIERIIYGMNSIINKAENTGRIVTWSIMGAITDLLGNFTDIGNDIVSNMGNGIKGMKSSAIAVMDILCSEMADSAKQNYNSFYNAGAYLVRGFADGINANISVAGQAGGRLASAASSAAASALDEHSPSKVGYRIGDYFGVAFVDAIENYREQSYSAGTNIADSARTGLSEAISRIRDIIDDDMELNPTIRPVLDLTDLKSGAGSIDSFFTPDRTIDLSSKAGYSINSNFSSDGKITVNNTEIIGELNKLRGDISSLGEIINGMKVVLDTGALVGSIATPINYALGKRSVYQKRGN